MKIKEVFQRGPAIISYLTAGDGGLDFTFEAVTGLIESGINILEIGVPFSDPVVDGPVIQRAMQRALSHKVTLLDTLKLIKRIKQKHDVPIILFTYLNPILAFRNENIYHRMQESGVDGILIVDLPLEEADQIYSQCLANQVAPIYVASPSTPLSRIKKMAEYKNGFLYYACRKGTTGVQVSLPIDLVEKINQIKTLIDIPVAVGFGISNHQHVSQVLSCADGVVIGSLLVKAIEDGAGPAELKKIVSNLIEERNHEITII